MSDSPESVRQDVREHYTQIAETGGSCCGPDTCGCKGYSDAELALIPAEAVAIGLGCGNPTAMIDLARRNAAHAGVRNVEFLPGDLENLPLPDASVDVIISNCVVNLTPDKLRALREAFRVLRPGGRLAISDIVIDPDLAGFPVPEAELRRSLDWAACAAGALTTSALRAALTQAGFADIDLEVVSRTTTDDLPRHGSPLQERLGDDGLRELAHRFTSTSIKARRPA